MGFKNWHSEHGAIGGGGQQKRWLTGSGVPRPGVYPFGKLSIQGKAGDIIRIPVGDFLPHSSIQGEVLVQASIAAVIVSTTLADLDLALNPEQDAGDHWVVDTTAAPGSIIPLKTVATCLKLEFTGDAILYIVGY